MSPTRRFLFITVALLTAGTAALAHDAGSIAARAQGIAVEQSVEMPLSAVEDARVMAEIVGSIATVKVSLAERTSVDAKAVAKILSAEQMASVSKTSQYEVIRFAWNRAAAA